MRKTLITFTALAMMAATPAWAETAAQICKDAASYEALGKGGVAFEDCITAAAAGTADKKCIMLIDESMKLIDQKEHECMGLRGEEKW